MAEAEKQSSNKRLVLVAIDASPQAHQAFEWYVENCHSNENELLLVHIADPPFVSTQQVMYMSGDLWTQMLEAEKEKVRNLEEEYADKMREKGVPGRIKAIFHARPGEAIVELAKNEKAQLIVMGTRGLGTVRRTIMGSVSDYVLHHIHCPILIYRSKEQATAASQEKMHTDS